MNIHPPIDPQHELALTYTPLLAQLLMNRGIRSKEDAEVFLNPVWETNYDPFLLHNVEEMVVRLKQAIDTNENITIYADYDADGIPGSVVLATLLDKIGYTNYNIYLPHRHDEGYGIHLDALEKIKASGTTLIITIDVGITGHNAATWCKEQNLDLIITDHHEPICDVNGKQILPEAFLLINPKQEQCSYPDDMLCGCGVIFKCVQAFIKKYGDSFNIQEGWDKWLLDMVGLSTISDMVPLINENRIFAYFGMKVIKKTKRPGLKKLIWSAGLNINHLTEEDLAFSVTPKLNAASRMSHPEDALHTLIASNEVKADAAVKHLDALNNERKKLVASTMKSVTASMENRPEASIIVIGSPNWQAGILGLVASKITEKYNKPAFVWSEEQGVIKGSARSAHGVDLVKLMSLAEESAFIQFGGHAEAGGFSTLKKEIHFLQERMEQAYIDYVQKYPEVVENETFIDAHISLNEINMDTYKKIRSLAPFGQGNPKPLFLISGVTPIAIESFGKQQNHLKISFKKPDGSIISAIQFFKTPNDYPSVSLEKPIDIIVEINYSVFRGIHELRLGLVEIN